MKCYTRGMPGDVVFSVLRGATSREPIFKSLGLTDLVNSDKPKREGVDKGLGQYLWLELQ